MSVTVDFRDFVVFLRGRDPGTLKSDIVSTKHLRFRFRFPKFHCVFLGRDPGTLKFNQV